ncbi:DUF3040 domain-containing protein [Actinomadura parmotrematis]|uniref:DUF3040 domain-containing protein n=1 Tax=Actinomadura parmotrematis TaxID=2864039 RepID=A0ABS7FT46_9ACTN|nr:DUF3040 domain-containing protein [Actinomadura parmotrematis]MBW8482757.1 DUF3040 domain-containing protein [Actinomadura parmotrematis]
MALSTHERKILEQIETHLRADDPRLARRLTRHRASRTRLHLRIAAAVLLALTGIATVIGAALATLFS